MDGFIELPIRKCPYENANVLSKLCFWWVKKLFVLGDREDLKLNDIFCPQQSDESERVTDKLERAWKREEKKLKNVEHEPESKKTLITSGSSNFVRAICVVFWWDYLKAGIGMFIMSIGLRTLQPLLQRQIINHFGTSGSKKIVDQESALYYTTGLILNTVAVIMFNHHSLLLAQKVAMRVRVACGSLIYRKVLRLNKLALNNTTHDQIINLLSDDVSNFDKLAILLHHLWIMPIQVCVIGAAMYMFIGPVALIGLSTLLLLILPIQIIINKYNERCRRNVDVLTDRRIQIVDEIINEIQVVKMYAWEIPFFKLVLKARSSEKKTIRKMNYLRSLSLVLTIFASKLNLFLTLLTYVLLGNTLTAEITFTIAFYFDILHGGSVFFFPEALMQISEAAVSVKRLQEFLLLDELTGDKQITSQKNGHKNRAFMSEAISTITCNTGHMPRIEEASEKEEEPTFMEAKTIKHQGPEDAVFVEMERISANWKIGQLPPTLSDISIKIHGGELCALVGQAGSGKSSFLNVLLKELPIASGNLYLRQRFDTDLEELLSRRGYVMDNPKLVISYSSQDAWLFTGTVRDNILFGQPYDSKKYHEVTRACALWRDLRLWPQGDMTTLGERGIALSKQQKALINLARAVYKDADVYLLDDPLNSIDTRLRHHLFKKCINGYLKRKTCILVTHEFEFLDKTDTIIVLDRGKVKAQGSFEDLSKSSTDFVSLLNALNQSNEKNKMEAVEDFSDETKVEEAVHENSEDMLRWDSGVCVDSLGLTLDYTDDGSISSRSSQPSEVSLKPKMSFSIWLRYITASGSLPVVILMCFILAISQMALTGTEILVCYWSNLEPLRSSLIDPETRVTTNAYNSLVNDTIFAYFGLLDEHGLLPLSSVIYIYTFMVIAAIILIFARSIMFFVLCIRASDNLHNSMFGSILHATMRFFNRNTSAKILDRFSRDVGIMDELLPPALLEVLHVTLLMTSVFLIVVTINHWMILPMIPLIWAFYRVIRCYSKTAFDIKRIEGICRRPALWQLNATLEGLATIRSNGPVMIRTLRKQFDNYQDVHSGSCYTNIVASATASLWLDFLSLAFASCVCFSLVLLDDGKMFRGTAGLAIFQAIQLPGLLHFGLKNCADVRSFMKAIERILQYVDIESEDSSTSNHPPPPNWPARGRISLKNVHMSYNDAGVTILKNLNLTIQAGWKVGVVGCTEEGKSSLISAIFRLENESLDGEIKIDGRNTRTLDLKELRSCISIITQKSALFSGTIRFNLDPFDSYDDTSLLDALRKVELDNLSLAQPVSKGGSNFDADQRLLICLARAILKKNRILILEEIAADIDEPTDALIQKTLKTRFGRCTVITIAHRLFTVIESDRIVLMDRGEVIEFGCPYELLCGKPNGPFAEMVRQTGPEVAENLLHLAKESCLRVLPQHSLDLERSNSEEHPTQTEQKQ